jgi:hypothetical protein
VDLLRIVFCWWEYDVLTSGDQSGAAGAEELLTYLGWTTLSR